LSKEIKASFGLFCIILFVEMESSKLNNLFGRDPTSLLAIHLHGIPHTTLVA
jgi:hypothetical protein